MIKLDELKAKCNFEPKYSFAQVQQSLPQGFDMKIMDSRLVKAVAELTKMAYPTVEDKNDRRWLHFYLPLKRRGYFVLVPLSVVQYDSRFFLGLPHSQVEVGNGKENNEFLRGIVTQTLAFSPILKKDPEIVTKALPYDIRTGRILGKYVLEDLLPNQKKEEMLKLYANHLRKGGKLNGVSLNEYLNTAAICYEAYLGSKTRGMSDEQMYDTWADGRDCGMLKIKNRESKKAFRHWVNIESGCGGHPFEIIFSMVHHGIDLFPPSPEHPHFILRVSNYMYAMPFLTIVAALIRNNVPFEAYKLEHVLDYLSGETYFTVNAYSEHSIDYYPGEKHLLRHIEWDRPDMLEWK